MAARPAAALKGAARLPITGAMSISSTIARIETIRHELADPAEMIGSSQTAAVTGGTEAPAGTSFADALAQAGLEAGQSGSGAATAGTATASAEGVASPTTYAGYAGLSPYGYGLSSLDGVSQAGASTPGARIVAAAESQIGQAEEPLGSNEGSAIAMYRSATAGAIPGAPWCAYFASWAARQAGEPIGPQGQGLGAVSEIWSWAQSTGRAIPNGPGVTPQPGDLIVFGDEHVGIVRDVLPGGDIQTIEGNYENKVSANVRTPTEATGYVDMNMS